MYRRKTHAIIRLAAVAVLLTTPRLSAQTVSWANPVSGDWFDGSKWSGGTSPTGSNQVVLGDLGAPYRIDIATAGVVACDAFLLNSPQGMLAYSGGVLNTSQELRIQQGTFAWGNGHFGGGGAFRIDALGTLAISDPTFKSMNKPLFNSGLITVAPGGQFNMGNQCTLTNNGTVQLNDAAAIYGGNTEFVVNNGLFITHAQNNQIGWGQGLTFTNAGTLRKTGANLVAEFTLMNSTGTIDVQGGDLQICGVPGIGGGTIAGVMNVVSGASLQLAGQNIISSAASSGAGTIKFFAFSSTVDAIWNHTGNTVIEPYSNASVEFLKPVNGPIDVRTGTANFYAGVNSTLSISGGVANLNQAFTGSISPVGGTVNFQQPSTLTGTSVWSGGNFGGSPSGTLTIAAGATLSVNGSNFKSMNKPVINSGQIVVGAGNQFNIGSQCSMLNQGTIALASGAGIYGGNSESLVNNGFIETFEDGNTSWGQGLTLVNNGTLRKTGGGLLGIYAYPINNGTIEVQSGSLSLNSVAGVGGGTLGGTLSIAVGSSLWLAGQTILPSANTLGGGSIKFFAFSSTVDAVWNHTGNTIVEPYSNASIDFLKVVNSPIEIRSGTANFHAGVNSTLSISGGVANLNQPFTGSISPVGGTVNFQSPSTLTGNSNWSGGDFGGSPSGTLTIAANATLSINGSNFKSMNKPVINSGQIVVGAGNQFNIGSQCTLTNNGVFELADGGAVFGGNTEYLVNNGLMVSHAQNISIGWGQGLTLTNNGVLRKSGTNIAANYSFINNAGTIEVQAGELQIAGVPGVGGGNLGGTLSVANGTRLGIAGQTLTSQAVSTGTGEVWFFAYSSTVNGTWNHAGATRVNPYSNQTVTFNGPVISPVTVESGTAEFGSTQPGVLNAASVTVTGSGRISVVGGTTTGNSGGLRISGTSAAIASVDGFSTNSGSLTLDGANWPLGTSGVLNNTGRLTRTGSGSTLVPNTRTINNSGTLTVSGGTMVIGSSSNLIPAINPTTLTGGNWVVSNDGWLGFGAAAGNGGTISTIATGTRVTLDGIASQMPALNSLTSNSGTLEVRGGKTFFNGLTLTNNGTMSVGAASEWLSLGGISLSGGTILLSSDNASPAVFRLSGQFLVPAVGPSPFGSAILSTGNGSLAGSIDMMNRNGVFNVANVPLSAIDLDVSANLTNGNLTKSGNGVMRISGVNSYQGATNITAGTLLMGANATLPQASSIQMTSGSTLDLSGFNQTVGGLAGTGTILLGGASLTVSGLNRASFSGDISGNGAFRKAGSGTLLISGIVNHTGPLTVSEGELQLTGTSNTFAGPINITGGLLSASSDLALGDPLFQPNPINLSGGTFRFFGETARTLTSTNNSSIAMSSGGTLGGVLAGTGTLNFFNGGPSSINMTGTVSYSGNVNVESGGLRLAGGVARMPNVPSFRVSNGTLQLDRSVPGPGPLLSSGPAGSGGLQDVRLNGGTLLVNGSNVSEDFATLFLDGGASTIQTSPEGGGTLTLNFGSFAPRASGATLNWIASNPGVTDKIKFASGLPAGFIGSFFTINGSDFAKYDAALGVLPFTAADYNTGFVRDTHVLLNAAATVPDTTLNPPDPFNIRTLNLTSAGSLNVTIPATTTLQLTEGGLLKSGAGTSSISGGTLTWGGSELNVSVSGGTLDISSTITRTGAGTFILTKRGSGTLTLSGSNSSTYSGITVVSGAMELNKPAGTNSVPGDLLISGGMVTSQANEQIINSAIVTLNAGAFNLNGKTETIAQLINNNGTVLFSGGTLTTTSTTLNGGTTTIASTLNASGALNINGGTNTVSTTGLVNVSSLTFSGGNSALIDLASGAAASGQIVLSGDVSASPTTGTFKIISSGANATPGRLDLGGAVRTFTIGSGSSREDLLISAQVASGGVIKTGPGMMQMSGANTYTQGTTINSGTLEGTSTAAFGSGSIQFGVGTTTVGTLGLRSDAAVATFGNAIAAGGTARPMFVDIDRISAGGGNKFVLGTATLGNNLTVTGVGTLQVSSLALTTTAVINPFGTTLAVNGGIHGASLGVIYGGASASPGGIIPGSGGGNNGDPIGTIILNGSTPSTNTGLTTVAGGAFLGLNHTPGQFSVVGPLSLTDGTVFCMQSDQFAHSVNVSMTTPGGIFDLNGTVQTIHDLLLQAGAVQTNGGTLNITGTISTPPPAGGLPEGSGTPSPANVSIQGNLALAPNTIFNLLSNTDQLTMNASLTATSGLTLNGAGQLNLNGNNTIGGTITLNGGTINALTPASLGTATIVLNGGILNSNGSLSNRVVLGGSGGQVNVPLSQTLTMNQTLSGAGLTKIGAGTLILAGANSFTGNINLSAGTLQIASEGNLGTVANPLNLNGGNLTYSQNLSTTRTINLNGGAIAVASNQAVSLDGSGTLSGTGSLIKTGSGTLIVNRPRSYQGATQVSGGTLSIASQSPELLAGGTLNGGVWIVEANSTLNLAGPEITTNKASVTLRGQGSTFTNLTNFVRNEGNFTVDANRLFVTAAPFTNSGTTSVSSSGGLKITTALANTGTIDLSGAMVVDYSSASPIASLRSQVLSGYAAGTWRGAGINSSAAAGEIRKAIAVAEASDSGVLFTQIPTDGTSVILVLAARGDTNLDSAVNSLDFNRFTGNYGKTSSLWTEGDFNYDNRINTQDFNYLAGNFGVSIGTLPLANSLPEQWILSDGPRASAIPDTAGGLGTIVPEPGSLGSLIAICLAGRKRRCTAAKTGATLFGETFAHP